MSVPEYRARAQAAAQAGDQASAARILGEATTAFPADAALWNSAGSAAMQAGDAAAAAESFAQARRLDPRGHEFLVNHAIALGRLGRQAEALAELRGQESAAARELRYCSVRAATEREAGNLGEAARWYDAALALDPAHARAAHGRARVALERAEPDAVERFDRALARNGGDPELWLGKAQALDAAGDVGAARRIADALAQQAPHWLDGLRFAAQLLVAQGAADFAAPFRQAAQRMPGDPNIPAAHCAALAALDHAAEAAEIAADARRRFPAIERFALLEAVHAGEAGQDDRAEAIWSSLAVTGAERDLHEARHRLRRGETDRAAPLLDRLLAGDPGNIGGWALRGVLWRLTGDPRQHWLLEQPGLVQFLPLRGAEEVLPEAVAALDRLHDGSPMPLGQSLRGGTQTRGGLFDRCEPVFARLRDAIVATLADYRAALPPIDADHPLLRLHDREWHIAGSWSVRLAGGGDHHTSHIHTQGAISSALYLELPDDIEGADKPGWLEIGRPPADLRLDLPPLATIRPQAGHLALFPSTLYHGTRPFAGQRRMTVAFDVRESPAA